MHDLTSLSLLERAKAEDSQAWRRITEIYGHLIYHWCHKFGLNGAEIPDVLQEVFRAVFQGLQGFHRETESGAFRAWLRTITVNKIRDHYRRVKKQTLASGGSDAMIRLQQVEDAITADGEPDAEERDILMQKALSAVKNDFQPTTWQSFWMTTIENRTSIEVAEHLGVTANSVRHSKARVLRRLREELKGIIDL